MSTEEAFTRSIHLAELSEVNDHHIVFDSSCVVDCEAYHHNWLFVESLHIQVTPGNVRFSTNVLLSIYYNRLRHIAENRRDPTARREDPAAMQTLLFGAPQSPMKKGLSWT